MPEQDNSVCVGSPSAAEVAIAFSSEVETGSRQENASRQKGQSIGSDFYQNRCPGGGFE